MAKIKKGFLFDNPDREANRNLLERLYVGRNPLDPSLQIPSPGIGWGEIVTPDEIRYSWMNGNGRLVTVDGSYITDENLRGWVHETTKALSRELQHEIYPTVYRYRPKGNIPRYIEPHAEWYDAHDYENQDLGNNFYIELRHRPLIRLLNWDFVNPVAQDENGEPNGIVMDMTSRAKIKYETAELRNVGALGLGFSYNKNVAMRSTRVFGGYPATKLPATHYIDYIAGYDSADRVPADLRQVIGMIVAIKVMSVFGDGRAAGVASFSIGVGVLSESISTTQSATSAMYGARILELENKLKQWYENHSSRYNPIRMAML